MNITITQLGGHLGSYAGDCAIIQIQSDSHSCVVVIDTGDSTAVPAATFKKLVGDAHKATGGSVALITTHRHKDHYDEEKAGYVVKTLKGAWYHGDKVTGGAWGGGTFVCGSSDPGRLQVPNILAGKDQSGWVWQVDCWAPDWTLGAPSDENDVSLATAVYASNGIDGFSFITLGDLTPDGARRLAWPLFIADIAKFPHHGSENNRIDFFSSSLLGGVRDTVLISGDSTTAAPTVLWLYGQNPSVKARVLLRTDAADTHFKKAWQALYELNKATASKVDLHAGKDVTLGWSSDKNSVYTLTQTGEQSYQEVVTKASSRRQQTSMLWE
jgi:hypothetical protein